MARPTHDISTRGPSILTCGFVALDTLVDDGVLGYTAGGTAGNVAAALAFLGWQASVAAVVGGDEAGRRLRRDLARAGVNTRQISLRDGAVTPQVIHEIHDYGHRYHFRCYDCGRRLAKSLAPSATFADQILEEQPDPDVFFFDRASRFSVTLAEEYAHRGTIVVFEPATRGRADLVARAYAAASIVKCANDSATDVRALLRQRDERTFILTNGGDGVRFRHRLGGIRHVRALSVAQVIDAAGAGDWTTTGLLHALLAAEPTARRFSEQQIRDAIGWGQAVAALNCAWRGARGIARARDAATVSREAAALLAGTTMVQSASERFSARVSGPLCRVCLGPGAHAAHRPRRPASRAA
jgi:fructokinase